MKILTTSAILTLLTGSAVASIPLGRGEISLSASAAATYDSNVNGNSSSFEDYYGTFTPRIAYIRKAGKIEADGDVGMSFTRWVNHREFNSDDLHANAALRLSQSSFQNISGSLNAGYNESFDVNNDVNQRIRSKSTTFNGQAGLVTGARTDIAVHGSYMDTERTGASDQKSLGGGGSFHYKDFLENTTLGLIYDYTKTSSSGENIRGVAIDQDSHQFSVDLSRPLYREVRGHVSYGYHIVNRSAAETAAGETRQTDDIFSAGIDGPFLPARMFPKIKSHFSISYSDATSPGVNDTGSKQLTGDIGLDWEARENTSVNFGASRSQNLAATDLTVVTSEVHAGVQQKLRYNLSGSLGVAYSWSTYRGVNRSDKNLSGNAGLNYTFARSWSANASYRYVATTSNVGFSEYARHIATLGVTYTF